MSSVNFNTFSAGAIGGGAAAAVPGAGDADAYEYATYLAMVADIGNRSAGDRAQLASGLTYEKVASNWIPQYVVENGSPLIIGVVKGDTVPGSEAIPFTDTVGGGGTVTSDGTRVKFLTALVTDTAYSELSDTNGAGGLRWIDALVTVNSATSMAAGDDCYLDIMNGTKELAVTVEDSVDPFAWSNYRLGTDGNDLATTMTLAAGVQPDLTVEHHLLIIMDAGGLACSTYVNGILVSASEYNLQGASALKRITLGMRGTAGGGVINLEMRELVYGSA